MICTWLALLPLALADPAAGEDFHVPVFVDALDDFWTVTVAGEAPIALNAADDALALVKSTLDRCPQISTIVVRSEPQVPWSRSASILMGLQSSKKTLALQGPTVDRGGGGASRLQAEGRQKRVGDRAVLTLTGEGLSLDGTTLCWEKPDEPLCGGDFRYLRSQLGGRDVAILASPDAQAGLVLYLLDVLGDHAPVFAAESSSRLARFEATRLPEGEPWVVLPCDKPLNPPEPPR